MARDLIGAGHALTVCNRSGTGGQLRRRDRRGGGRDTAPLPTPSTFLSPCWMMMRRPAQSISAWTGYSPWQTARTWPYSIMAERSGRSIRVLPRSRFGASVSACQRRSSVRFPPPPRWRAIRGGRSAAPICLCDVQALATFLVCFLTMVAVFPKASEIRTIFVRQEIKTGTNPYEMI